jgi:hypothetical protein
VSARPVNQIMLPVLPVTVRLPALTMLVPMLLPILHLSPPRAAATVSHAPARAPPRPRAGPRAGLVAPGAGARTPPHRPRHRIRAWPPRPESGACDHEIHRHMSLSRLSCKCIQGLANRELGHKRWRPRYLLALEARQA